MTHSLQDLLCRLAGESVQTHQLLGCRAHLAIQARGKRSLRSLDLGALSGVPHPRAHSRSAQPGSSLALRLGNPLDVEGERHDLSSKHLHRLLENGKVALLPRVADAREGCLLRFRQ